MPVLAFANLKGGVAKTSNAVAVAETLASKGHRVLVIDADHQCTASEVLLGEGRMLKAEANKRTLHDLLVRMLDPAFESASFESFVIEGEAGVKGVRRLLSVLPCSFRIDEFQSNVAKARRGFLTGADFTRLWSRRRVAMAKWLQSSFDYVIIDCPPSMSRHVQFFLRMSDGIVIPAVPDHLSLRGAIHFEERLRDRGITTRVVGTLWTLYRAQVEKHRVVVSLAARRISRPGRVPLPFTTVIPNAAALASAADPDQTFTTVRQKYTPEFARLYENLCDEIASRLDAPRPKVARQQPRLAGVA
jgi:chromosome partitioning protein